MRTWNGFLLGGLVVALGVLGYLYYQETRNNVGVKIELPRVQIEK